VGVGVGVGVGMAREDMAVLSSRVMGLESEKALLEKELARLKQHHDNWQV
jgi:hypothetical protein